MTISYKEFTGKLEGWTKKAINVRNESQELTVVAMSFLVKDFNTNGLTDMVNALHSVRGYDVSNFMKYLFFLTGGDTGITEKGLPVVDPEKSMIEWDGTVFKVKSGASFDPELIYHLMGTWKWFDFCPKSIKNPYTINNLFTALKKAGSNKSIVTGEEAKLIDALMQQAADMGYAERLEQ